MQTKVLGHSLVHLLIRLHRSLVHLLCAVLCAYSSCSLTSLNPKLVEQWMIQWFFSVFSSILDHSARLVIPFWAVTPEGPTISRIQYVWSKIVKGGATIKNLFVIIIKLIHFLNFIFWRIGPNTVYLIQELSWIQWFEVLSPVKVVVKVVVTLI